MSPAAPSYAHGGRGGLTAGETIGQNLDRTIARFDDRAALVQALRWRDRKSGYVPFGTEVHAERTFAGTTTPSRLTAGWGHGTPSSDPLFKAEVIAVEPLG